MLVLAIVSQGICWRSVYDWYFWSFTVLSLAKAFFVVGLLLVGHFTFLELIDLVPLVRCCWLSVEFFLFSFELLSQSDFSRLSLASAVFSLNEIHSSGVSGSYQRLYVD